MSFNVWNLIFLGAKCPDGSDFVPLISGSEWTNKNGIWNLIGCPAGYTLNSQECELCPGGAYCVGGSIPATPCPSRYYALPGGETAGVCYPAVFVIVTTTVPILRAGFSDEVGLLFQIALASVCGLNPGYVVIQGLVGDAQTSISCKIASDDAESATELAQSLSSDFVQRGLDSHGFPNCSLESVQVTGCLPGFELTEGQTCQLCPAASFCVGGSSPSRPCSAGYYSFPGSNSSKACRPVVFVVVVVSLPIAKSNFTESETLRFLSALANAVHVDLENVFVVTAAQSRRESASSLQITAEIAAADSNAAESIVDNLSPSVLDACLMVQGLPTGSLQSVTTVATNPQAGAKQSLPIIVGVLVGSFAIFISFFIFVWFRKVESEEEQELRCTMHRLRVKFGLTAHNGYLVG